MYFYKYNLKFYTFHNIFIHFHIIFYIIKYKYLSYLDEDKEKKDRIKD